MKTTKYIYAVILLSFTLCVNAQSKGEYEHFIKEAGFNTIIKTGLVPISYYTISEGHYFAESNDFKKGDIRYNGSMYYDLLLNLNSHLDEVYVKDGTTGEITVLIKSYIDHFSLENGQFKRIDNRQMSGFHKVLYDGEFSLYKKIKKEYYETIDRGQQSLIRGFKENVSYFLIKDENITKINKAKGILNLFKEHKRELKRELKRSGFNPKKHPDQYLMTAADWLNSNID